MLGVVFRSLRNLLCVPLWPLWAIARALGIRDPSELLLTPGCTAALALAIGDLPWESGDVVLTTDPGASPVTAGFEFDVPVRFDSDTIEVNMAAFEAGEIPSVLIIEVRV